VVRRVIFGSGGLEDTEALSAPDPSPSAEAGVLVDEQAMRLDRAIARLPAPLKEPLLLTAFEGLSHHDAAQILGVSIKTIETRVYRARKLLAEQLDTDMRPSAR